MRIAAGLTACLLGGSAALAGDGSWTQIDAWDGGAQWVTNVERGAWHMGMAAGIDDDEWWTNAAILRTFTVGSERPWKLRAGAIARAEQIMRWELEDYDRAKCWGMEYDDCAALRFGVRLSADRWAQYGNWGTFLMAEWTSIDDTKLAVAGLTYMPNGLNAQFSLWHEKGGEVTPTVMISKPVTKRLSLRAGHKFVEEQTFIGFSFSTY